MLKRNTLYSQLFRIYFLFVVCLLFVLLFVLALITDNFIVRYNSTASISILEKTADNITYRLQQDINLTYSLAANETVINNLTAFRAGTPEQKVTCDNIMETFFNNYWNSHQEIIGLKIFLKNYPGNTISGFKSIRYLSENENAKEWVKYFQSDSSVFIPEYSWNDTSYSSFNKNTALAAIIVPIIYKSETIGHLCMDIDKNALFSPYLENVSYANISKIALYDAENNVIFGEKELFGTELELQKRIFSSPRDYTGSLRTDQRYCVLATQPSSHGLRLVQFFPYKKITNYRIPIIFIALLLLIIFYIVTWLYTKNNALLITRPLAELSGAMSSLSPVNTDSVSLVDEFANIYNTYNTLLSENKKISQQHTKAEIHSLLAQISPHFLYNTLSVIVWKAAAANQPEITSIVSKLAKLFQSSYNFRSDFITLRNEINHADLYMQLQKECFINEFDFEIVVPQEFLNLMVPRFILQPIIENSIIHGFSQIGYDGYIRIACTEDKDLEITISDNGSGITDNILNLLNNNEYKTEKYGIYNINKRIKMLCGEQYGILFKSNGHRGTTATLTLPVIANIEEHN